MNGSCCGFSVPSSANAQNLSFAKLPAFPQAAQHTETVRPPYPADPHGLGFFGSTTTLPSTL